MLSCLTVRTFCRICWLYSLLNKVNICTSYLMFLIRLGKMKWSRKNSSCCGNSLYLQSKPDKKHLKTSAVFSVPVQPFVSACLGFIFSTCQWTRKVILNRAISKAGRDKGTRSYHTAWKLPVKIPIFSFRSGNAPKELEIIQIPTAVFTGTVTNLRNWSQFLYFIYLFFYIQKDPTPELQGRERRWASDTPRHCNTVQTRPVFYKFGFYKLFPNHLKLCLSQVVTSAPIVADFGVFVCFFFQYQKNCLSGISGELPTRSSEPHP